MEVLISALVLGLMGSFHCVGMCGPIAISLPLRGDTLFEKLIGGSLYNIGRTVTYGIMGAVFGLIGQGFQLMGFQRWISIIMGVLMVLSILVPTLFKGFNTGNSDFLTGKLRQAIGRLFAQKSYRGLFLIGLLNGLLPCGLVYMAIAGAIGTGTVVEGILFMVVFGLGTLPMLLFISILGNVVSVGFRNKISKAIPYLVVVIGLIFILRGLSLGIPYLSPPKAKLNPEVHMNHG
ncbi:MAG: sulfite exporter TauE/SafE family protein [Bacteroidales bacterium]|nr:sulfite exporter TauE/SafE family protein [Bacteroidales bacterium]